MAVCNVIDGMAALSPLFILSCHQLTLFSFVVFWTFFCET